jgi:hypothetical protein
MMLDSGRMYIAMTDNGAIPHLSGSIENGRVRPKAH